MTRIIEPPLEDHRTLRQPLTKGESIVLDFFNKRLPPEWEIYVQPHLNGLRPDFVLLNPNVGIAVFEVKDWNLDAMEYYRERDNFGYEVLCANDGERRFSVQNKNPATQVNRYRNEISQLYCPRLSSKGGFAAVTAGVIFPFADSKRVRSLLEPFLQLGENEKYKAYQPISGIRELGDGDLYAVFPESSREDSKFMTPALADDLRGWLVEPDFSKTQRQPLELDKNQQMLADTRTDSGYRRIKGPAGSGKSLILAARAAKLADEGKSVLIVTYNITLWHYLRDTVVRGLKTAKSLQNISFSHFHYWCKGVCYDAGWDEVYDGLFSNLPKSGESRQRELTRLLEEVLPALAIRAMAEPGAQRYDAVLVDEGQDYHPSWWAALRTACKPGGEMVLVADATQDVYGTAKAWTEEVMTGAGFPGGRWAQLGVSYRLPPDMLNLATAFAERFLPGDTADIPQPEQGSLALYPCNLRWVQCEVAEAQELCVRAIISLMHQSGKAGLANADITLLTANMALGKRVVIDLEEFGPRVVQTFSGDKREQRRAKMGFYMGDARVKATTLHSFKGWETRALVIHVDHAESPESLALIYAGLTRLKRSVEGSWLTVVCSAPALKEYGETWPQGVAPT